MLVNMKTCPLCSSDSKFYLEDKKRSYRQCSTCDLVFVPEKYILTADEEKAEYDLHENDPEDPGYRKFLSRIFDPVQERSKPAARGLDFGCGPGPALSQMFSEAGYEMAKYDLYYFPDDSVLNSTYDFVTCTEVIEHIRESEAAFELLFKLTPDGVLGLMTKLVKDKEAFAGWHYKNDPTHIRFYSRKTFEYVAEKFKLKVEFIGSDVIILE
jgi:hypothetical protein